MATWEQYVEAVNNDRSRARKSTSSPVLPLNPHSPSNFDFRSSAGLYHRQLWISSSTCYLYCLWPFQQMGSDYHKSRGVAQSPARKPRRIVVSMREQWAIQQQPLQQLTTQWPQLSRLYQQTHPWAVVAGGVRPKNDILARQTSMTKHLPFPHHVRRQPITHRTPLDLYIHPVVAGGVGPTNGRSTGPRSASKRARSVRSTWQHLKPPNRLRKSPRPTWSISVRLIIHLQLVLFSNQNRWCQGGGGICVALSAADLIKRWWTIRYKTKIDCPSWQPQSVQFVSK